MFSCRKITHSPMMLIGKRSATTSPTRPINSRQCVRTSTFGGASYLDMVFKSFNPLAHRCTNTYMLGGIYSRSNSNSHIRKSRNNHLEKTKSLGMMRPIPLLSLEMPTRSRPLWYCGRTCCCMVYYWQSLMHALPCP